MSIDLNGKIDDCNKLENSTGTSKKAEVNYGKFFENRIEREWLTTKEAAYFLSVSENALRIMVHRNQIEVFRFGRRLRFRLDDCRTLFARKGA